MQWNRDPWTPKGNKGGGKGAWKGFAQPSQPFFPLRNPNKKFKGANDELSLLRNATIASLELGLDNSRQLRNVKGMCVPTCLVPQQRCFKEVLQVEPNLLNPIQYMAECWRKLSKGLSEETKRTQELREKIAADNAKITNDEQLYDQSTCCSIYPCFENKELIKVELAVQPELRQSLLSIFKALVSLGGTMKYCAPPRRFPERQAGDALSALLKK